MYDIIRWSVLVLIFAGLLGLWLWTRRHAVRGPSKDLKTGRSFNVIQKRWLDQRTGVCLVETDRESFLLAYTVSGGVSWQSLGLRPEASKNAGKNPRKTKVPAKRNAS